MHKRITPLPFLPDFAEFSQVLFLIRLASERLKAPAARTNNFFLFVKKKIKETAHSLAKHRREGGEKKRSVAGDPSVSDLTP